MSTSEQAGFYGLVDLAARAFGGRAIACSDDFFASMHHLVEPGRGVFIAGKFTENGKWMDGWESRRKRGPGHDWCILELGAPGVVRALDIDTNHFLGNHPPYASLEGCRAGAGASLAELSAAAWEPLLRQAPLRPGSQNLFLAQAAQAVSHVRLNIFPDGGVARLRVYGSVEADFSRVDADADTAPRLAPGWVDLVALRNGGMPLSCSDAFFSPMQQLVVPGPARDMGSGWETRRRRGPGHDWMVVRLAARGAVRLLEVDTTHFKGNCPESCRVQVLDAPEEPALTELPEHPGWVPLLPRSPLEPHHRHFFDALESAGAATHLRIEVYPDGGLSRLRAWGERGG